jgi:teichuronic acid biosynthesis glycosyltransferase TuaG
MTELFQPEENVFRAQDESAELGSATTESPDAVGGATNALEAGNRDKKETPPSRPVEGLVSVVMPAYNSERCIAEAIASVRAQTYPKWEMIVIDDGSRDNTIAIVVGLQRQDNRIRILRLGTNGGVANARNVGIGAARGQYLAFLDSDDRWLPQKLHIQTEFMQRTGAAFTFSRYRRIGRDGVPGKEVGVPDQVNYRQLLKKNVIGCLTVMIDRNQVATVTMASMEHEDYIAWLQILKTIECAIGIQQDLARYSVSSASVSGNKRRSALWTWKVYRKVERLSLFQCVWYFGNYLVRALSSRL